MRSNFLPDYQPVLTGNALLCEIRDKAIRATPEEMVRQRVLHWLMEEKGWTKDSLRLEKSYRWVGDASRRRGRPDIELLGADGEVLVVVECKRPEVELDESVSEQAIGYARKARAQWIWTTNGDSHRFLRHTAGRWNAAESLKPLNVIADPPRTDVEFPADLKDEATVQRYWQSLADPQFLERHDDYDQHFLLAMHRVLFGAVKEAKLPYSHGGLHILEDRRSAWQQFGNRSGNSYYTRYADFIAATRGTVEAVSVAVNRWYPGLRLCVGVRKPGRSHHALQLDTEDCELSESGKSWHIYHDGAMSQVARVDVLEAVREAGGDRWIYEWEGKEWIYLGELPNAETANWKNSRKLLANLIHYGIIRSNLREATSAR